jgi:hypothetical protein
MALLKLSTLVLLGTGIALCAGPSDEADNSANRSAPSIGAVRATAPVLHNDDPADSVVVRLPGPPPAPVQAPKQAAPVVEAVVHLDAPPPASVSLDDPGRPVLRRAQHPIYPPDFDKDSGVYCQRLIGQWTVEDAKMLLGEAEKQRPSFDDNQKENGAIYAFQDPTNRYRQLELDFDGNTGALRTVFVYPWKMTWQDCRKLFGANVSAATAAQGRRFYSYLNRRLDVLVDNAGKVISLGLY